jgi:hypothetical protein
LNAIMVSIRFVLLILGGHKLVALENAALRHGGRVEKTIAPIIVPVRREQAAIAPFLHGCRGNAYHGCDFLFG